MHDEFIDSQFDEEENPFEESKFQETIRIESQDLRILKVLTTDIKKAAEFCSVYDSSLFFGQTKEIAHAIIEYVKQFNSVPSFRALSDYHKSNEKLVEKLSEAFQQLQETEYNEVDYKYDLIKFKEKFQDHKLEEIHSIAKSEYESETDRKQAIVKIEQSLSRLKSLDVKQTYEHKPIDLALSDFKDNYIKKLENPDFDRGTLTGYSYLDYSENGVSDGEILLIAGESNAGKALSLDTKIPTPNGLKLMKDIHPGDVVFGRNGQPCNVVAESEIINDIGYKFVFWDGAHITSHANHLWLSFDYKEQQQTKSLTDDFRNKRNEKKRKGKAKVRGPRLNFQKKPPIGTIRSTLEIVNSLKFKEGVVDRYYDFAIPFTSCINFEEKNLLIDPYTLGAWLGDGTSAAASICGMDREIIDNVVNAGYPILSEKKSKISKDTSYYFSNLRHRLRKLNLLKNKHIPNDYLCSSKEQRVALLQGLMDTDGTVGKIGQGVSFCNINKNIIDGIVFLIHSLGERCSVNTRIHKVNNKIIYNVTFSPKFDSFRLTRKLNRQKLRNRKIKKFRHIKNIEKIESCLMKCIQVDSPDNLYLATEYCIPTHNSLLLNNLAIQMWTQKNTIYTKPEDFTPGKNVLYFSLEMPYIACFRRTLARLSDSPFYAIRDAKLDERQSERLFGTTFNFIKNYPYKFDICDIARGVTVSQIERIYHKVCEDYIPDVVVIDYLGLMEDETQNVDDWLKLGKITGKFHEFLKINKKVGVTAVQLNRPPKGKDLEPSEVISKHRIGRSGMIMDNVSIAIQIYTRPEEKNYDDLSCHIVKSRYGTLGEFTLIKNFANSSVLDIPYTPPEIMVPTMNFGEPVLDLSERIAQIKKLSLSSKY